MIHIPFEELLSKLSQILESKGFSEKKAYLIAKVLSENTLDGYHSHGINRFVKFLNMIDEGIIDIHKQAKQIFALGAFERWDGQQGPGIINASFCMDRAIELAKTFGMACLALQNTNHWFRGGTYGWQAAGQNCIAICFTNTIANMPPWGAKESRTGNNPLVIAVPYSDGPIVLDISLSQFSYGKMSDYALEGKKLPFVGGYNHSNQLTDEPNEIIATRRVLPIGFWKGSGLSLMLDLLASVFTAGLSTAAITKAGSETKLSQVFICWDMNQITNSQYAEIVPEIIQNYCSAEASDESQKVAFPGQQTLERRRQYLREGIPIHEKIWAEILNV